MTTYSELDEFARGYIDAALWTATGDNGDPLDCDHTAEDIAPESLEAAAKDCAAFQKKGAAAMEAAEDFVTRNPTSQTTYAGLCGHNFLLTRNRHGAGFWDGDYPEPQAAQLTALAQKFGEDCDLYLGDDGRLYLS